MPRRVPLPPELFGDPLATRDARALGLTPSRLRSRDVRHPFRGVVTAHELDDRVELMARAALPRLRTGDAFSHSTGALLYGAELPASLETGPIHVLAARGADRITGAGLVGHRTRSAPAIRIRAGLPVVDPAVVWVQLASMLSDWDLVAVADRFLTASRAVGRVDPLVTGEELRAAVARAGRAPGVARARRALVHARSGVDSRQETRLRLELIESGFPEPVCAFRVATHDGSALRADLAWPEWRVALEYEGDVHRRSVERWRNDFARRERYDAAGWRLVRVNADHLGVGSREFLRDLRGILSRWRAALAT